MNKILLISFLFVLVNSQAQTFSGTTDSIHDLTDNFYTASVTGLPALLDTSNFGLETVCINLTHTYLADLQISLISPSGVSVLLISSVGGSEDNFQNTCLNTGASLAISEGSAPYSGTYKPSGQMGQLNNNQSGNGTWTLKISDVGGGDVGNLISWNITFGTNPASYFVFQSSNLPIVIINTNGQNINDSPKIAADMGIIYHGEGIRNYVTDIPNNYNGKIGIEYHGSSSQMFPKKPFGFELWDANNNAIDSALLNMPKENDWLLVAAYSDKTLLRNSFTYRTWEKMGYYSPRGENVEVLLNGQYWGVYYLCEKIKRGNDRLDIAKLTPTEIYNDEVTGGYILKVDKSTGSAASSWSTLYPPANNPSGAIPYIQIDYPDMNSIVPQQFDYIKNYVDSFETALMTIDYLDTIHGYRHFADEASFIDYLLISEMNKNVDGYRISTYFSKDKTSKGGKLKMGPVWDYDLAYGNANYCDAWKTDGWGYQFNSVCGGDGWQIPFWWDKMMQDTLFQNHLRCRWENLKPVVFDTVLINNYIDSMSSRLQESQQRNYETWPILGTYVWPNYYIGANYHADVDSLKWWLKKRFEWLDLNLPGNLDGCGFTGISEWTTPLAFKLFPNPFQSEITLQFSEYITGEITVEITNLIGEKVQQINTSTASSTVKIQLNNQLPKGMYYISIRNKDKSSLLKKMIKE